MMRALVFTAPGEMELREEPVPEPGPDELLLNVAAAGICGSELHGFRVVGMRKPPLIMGHEIAGTINGANRVVVNPLITCGTCEHCRAGRSQICPDRQLIGVHRAGGFAEHVAVPRRAVHELPSGMDWTAAALIEPLANAVHAWGLAKPDAGRVAVLGAGTIGLVCLLLARRRGHDGPIVVADPSPFRRAVAEQLGANVVSNLDDFEGRFDTVFDAVGLQATRSSTVHHLSPGGTAVWIGLAAPEAEFDGSELVRSEKRVLGSFGYTNDDFAHAVATAPNLDLGWATDIPMADARTVFMELAAGRTDIIKAVLRPEVG